MASGLAWRSLHHVQRTRYGHIALLVGYRLDRYGIFVYSANLDFLNNKSMGGINRPSYIKESVPEGCKECFVCSASRDSFVVEDFDTGVKYAVKYDSSKGMVCLGDHVVVRLGYAYERGNRGETFISAEFVRKCN